MARFAYLFQPPDYRQMKFFWPLANFLPGSLSSAFLAGQSLKIKPLKPLISAQGTAVSGYLIPCPLLPFSLTMLDEECILDKIVSAGWLAEKEGASILGVGGYLGAVADSKPMIHRHLKIPLTTGTTLTAWAALESLKRAAEGKNLKLADSTFAIIGPFGKTACLCAEALKGKVKELILGGDDKEKLEALKTRLAGTDTLVTVEPDANKAAGGKPFIVDAAPGRSSLDRTILSPESFLCDLTMDAEPGKIAGRANGLVTLPRLSRQDLPLPASTVPASLAEVILLTLERKLSDYSLGDNANLAKLEEMAGFAVNHGFEPY